MRRILPYRESAQRAEEQAAEFFNLCVEAKDEAHAPNTREECVGCRVLLSVAWKTLLTSAVCPFLLFCCILPLDIADQDGCDNVINKKYGFMVLGQLVAAVFARSIIRHCWDAAPSKCATFLQLGICVPISRIAYILSFSSTLRFACGLWSILACVYFPSIWLILTTRLRASVLFCIGMSVGSIPCLLTVVVGYICRYLITDDIASRVCMLLLWMVLPFPLKLVGRAVFRRCSPASKAMAPVLFGFYVEVAFSCFGTTVFMVRPYSAISYSCAAVPVCLFWLAMGTSRGFHFVPQLAELRLHRLLILFEVLAVLMGRIGGLIFYMCYVFHVLQTRNAGTPNPPQTYQLRDAYMHSEEVTSVTAWCCCFGICFSFLCLAAFCMLLPLMWQETEVKAVSLVSPKSVAWTVPIGRQQKIFAEVDLEPIGNRSICPGGLGATGEVVDPTMTERASSEVSTHKTLSTRLGMTIPPSSQCLSVGWTGHTAWKDAWIQQLILLQEFLDGNLVFIGATILFVCQMIMNLGSATTMIRLLADSEGGNVLCVLQ